MLLIGEGPDEALLAQQINDPRNAAGVSMDSRDRLRREDRMIRDAGTGEARAKISVGLGQGQRGERTANHDALMQLAKFAPRQFFPKLRLAGENDLHQFAGGQFEIEEQSKRVERADREALRLVNDDHRRIAGSVAGDEPLTQGLKNVGFAWRGAGNAEIAKDTLGEFRGVQLGVEDVGAGLSRMAKPVEEVIQQGGLAGACFT